MLRTRRHAFQAAHCAQICRAGLLRAVVHTAPRSVGRIRREHTERSYGHGHAISLQRKCFGIESEVGLLALSHRSVVVHDGRELRSKRCRGLHSHSWLAFSVTCIDARRKAKAFNRRGRGDCEIAEKRNPKRESRGCAMKMWSGRFRAALDPAFEQWQRSFEFDCRLLECELEASAAHARALTQAGVLSAEELDAVLHGLEQIGEQAAQSAEFLNDA